MSMRTALEAWHERSPLNSTVPALSPIGRKGQLNWQALSLAEKVVCANIVLIPLWWISGLYQYWAGLICMGIAYYEFTRYGKVRVGWPRLTVALLMASSAYQCIGLLMFSLATKLVTITAVIRAVMFWLPPTLLLWYAQSRRVRVRVEVVAWACSVLALQMLLTWVVGQIIMGGGIYDPPRSLFSLASGNASGSYVAGKGLANYLILYRPEDTVAFGLARWSYFFIIPELAGLASAFMALLALDIRNRRWAIGLFVICLFLLIMSGTRSVWLMLPLVIFLRYCFTFGRKQGYVVPLAALALCSFLVLSTPAITTSLVNTYAQTSESVSSYRGDSSDVRGEIYARTIKEIPHQLFLGHWIPGDTVLPGFDLGRVGTHSFILGSLLYRSGLVGTVLFLSFWGALAVEMCRTRHARTV